MLDETLAILDDLIAFETVALTPNLDLVGYCSERLGAVGADIRLTHSGDGTRANLFATIGPSGDGGIVLSGHTDVVPVDAGDWSTPPFEAYHRDGRVYGRGSADMKGFIACVLALAPRFAALSLGRPLHVALTFDEEDGFHGAPILLDDLVCNGPRPSAAIIGEPTGMEVVAAHKGCYEYTTTVTGRSGHSSEPGRAVNAVQYATRFITGLMELGAEMADRAPASSPYEPAPTTMSVGTITGGQARCVVADRCSLEWEMRPVQRTDADHVRTRLAELEGRLTQEMRLVHPGASIRTEVVCEVDGLEFDDASPALGLMRSLLGDTPAGVVSYGTEAGLFQAAGIPAVVWGPGHIGQAHRPDEYVEVDDLGACLAVLARLGDSLVR
ncbi:MAG: acetylornithine deacetylase [Actinobacteria bacterium]|nr:MAG: acetylornithine deacetylase [Actinomycetota bacterium]